MYDVLKIGFLELLAKLGLIGQSVVDDSARRMVECRRPASSVDDEGDEILGGGENSLIGSASSGRPERFNADIGPENAIGTERAPEYGFNADGTPIS